ncbi:MFS transporter [Catenuloplanes sp. NPDC051500]|uniref:MFS transporter n=1 Tax=Catenuloplanes sp. NPDC051500 TaxID=3363959 RepID=UPI0037999EF1
MVNETRPDTLRVPADPAGPSGAAVRRARWAITAVFFINGLMLATYIVRIPSIKADLALTDARLGLVMTCFGTAALLTMQFVGPLVAGFGSVRVIRMTLLLMPLVLVGIGAAGNVVVLAVGVVLLGMVHGTLDVAMNAHAVTVERLRGRPMMNSCHAAWSISAVIASASGASVIRAGIPTLRQFLVVGGVLLIAGLVASLWLLPASVDRVRRAPDGSKPPGAGWRSGWTGPVLIFGLMGLTIMLGEAAVVSWSGVFLHEDRGATLAVAALGYTAFTVFQTAGRLFGDRLTARFGNVSMFRASGVIAVAGLLVVVLGRSQQVTIVGFAILGAGMSVLVPLIFSAVGAAGGDGPGAATFVSRVTTFTYAGILAGPALIGWFAQAIGMTWTFAAIIPLMVGVVLAARVMGGADRDRQAATG